MMLRAGVLVAAVIAAAAPSHAGLPGPASERSSPAALLETLPPPLREQASAVLLERDETRRSQLADRLATNAAAAVVPFLIAVVESDASADVRAALVNRLGRNPAPEVQRMLEQRAAEDPDAGVSVLALERLRFQRIRPLRAVLDARLARARHAGDDAGLRALAREQERWISLARGTMLPEFLRVPPPPFSLKPPDKAVRLLAFGDFGDGGANQRSVA